MSDYILPRFDNLKSKAIEKTVKEIKKSPYYNPDLKLSDAPPIDRYREALRHFKNGVDLTTKEYKTLSYYLEDVEKEGLIEEFFKRFEVNMKNFISYRSFARPLLSYIYNNYDRSKYLQQAYRILSNVCIELNGKRKFENVCGAVKKNKIADKYLDFVQFQFRNITSLEDTEEILKKYLMKNTDRFYYKCLMQFIVKKHRDEKLFEVFKNAVNNMPLNLQQTVFKEIMECYVNELNIDKYPDNWFRLIGSTLKDPYSGRNTKWDGIGDKCKEIYRRWNNSKYLYDFFENKVVGGDQDRLNFWKDYIDNIYRIMYFKDANDALVMEFKDHTFIEFAQPNNALYIYNRRVYNVDKIEALISRNNRVTKDDLKDKNIVMTRWLHMPNWPVKFTRDMDRLGYEASGW